MPGEKAEWELHKNAACCLEQILEAAPHRATAGLVSLFNGISTFVDYLMPKPFS